jgi:ParB-like chromosome segregation protein Spo0J
LAKIKVVSDKIEMWPIEKLCPYPKNPKLHPPEQIDQLCKDIRAFGFIDPIVVHAEVGIIAGHGRLLAAKKLKMEELPVIVADHLSIEDAKAYLLADNKISEGYGYDNKLIAEIMAELNETAYDLSLTAFSEKEISAFLDPISVTDDTIKVSEIKEEKEVALVFGKFKFAVKQARFDKWFSESLKFDSENREAAAREIIKRLGL